MAEINRFEIGGIFYDCEDEDARGEIASLQRQRGLNYAATIKQYTPQIETTAPVNVFTAGERLQLRIYTDTTEVSETPSIRRFSIRVNGVEVATAGPDAAYPGAVLMIELDLLPGDVISIAKADVVAATGKFLLYATPYYN